MEQTGCVHAFDLAEHRVKLIQDNVKRLGLRNVQAAQGDAAAQQQLRAWAHYTGSDIEQRKAAWLAHAYAAERDCRNNPAQARAELDAVLAQIQLLLPEGGALPREIAQIRKRCSV